MRKKNEVKKKTVLATGWATAQLGHDTMELYRDIAVLGARPGWGTVSRHNKLNLNRRRLDWLGMGHDTINCIVTRERPGR